MDANAHEVREGLARVVDDLLRLVRSRTEDGGDVDGRVFEDGVGSGHGSDVTASPGIGHPGRWRNLAVLVDHLRRRIGGAPRGVEEGSRPIRERDAGPRRAIGLEVAERVGDRLAKAIRVVPGQRAQDAGGGVRDQDCVIVGDQRPVALDEVQQVRHLLQVRRNVGVVAPEVGVVELDVDDVLDVVARRLEVAGRGGLGDRGMFTGHEGCGRHSRGRQGRGRDEGGQATCEAWGASWERGD